MNGRNALVVVAVVLLTAATGCVGGGDADVGAEIAPDAEPVETNETGDELLTSALNTAEDVETYAVETETRMDLASFFGVSMEMNTSGEFDRGEGVAYTRSQGEAGVELLGLSGGEEFKTEVYQTSEARYTRRSNGSVTGDWNRSRMDAPLPLELGRMSRTVEEAEATVEGVEEVDGTEAYVLSLDVPVSDVGKDFSSAMETHGPENFGEDDNGGNASEGDVNTSETYLWIDRDTDRPLRFAYIVNFEFTGDGGDEAGGSMEFMGDRRYVYEDVEVRTPDGIDG